MTPRLQWIVKLKGARKRHLAADAGGAPSLRTLCGKHYAAEDRVKAWQGGELFTESDCDACRKVVTAAQDSISALVLQGGTPPTRAAEIAAEVLQIGDKLRVSTKT